MHWPMTAPSTQGSGPASIPTFSSAPGRVFGFNLHAGPLAATEARHALMAAENVGPEEEQPMLLLLTELVTNAIRHGGADERPNGLAVKVVESERGVGRP